MRYGASPRAAQALVLGGKIQALNRGQAFVSVDDIRAVALPALRHRLLLNFEGEAEEVSTDTIVDELLTGVAHVEPTLSAMPLRFEDEFLKKLEYLQVVSKRAFAGQNRADRLHAASAGAASSSPTTGQYTPGDDFRHIDWKAYKRLNRLLLRLFDEEQDLPIYLMLDVSRSMAEPAKFDHGAADRRRALLHRPGAPRSADDPAVRAGARRTSRRRGAARAASSACSSCSSGSKPAARPICASRSRSSRRGRGRSG